MTVYYTVTNMTPCPWHSQTPHLVVIRPIMRPLVKSLLYILHTNKMTQAAKCKWRALRHTCLLLLSVLGGMPASHQGMQARLFFVVDI